MITTLLDNDLYQFAMAQCVWAYGHDMFQVRYEFRNRTFAVPLASRIDLNVLRDRIEEVRDLKFTYAEVSYLRGTDLFQLEFLEYLQTVRLPEVEVASNNGHLVMTYQGDWGMAIFWETMLLSIVNELYYERFGEFTSEGLLRLGEKIEYLQARGTLRFVEFGTRRRFSKEWQHYVAHEMKNAVPDLLLGTSNVELARELELKPVGTMAHQLFMVYTALRTLDKDAEPVVDGAAQVLRQWGHVYGSHPEMLIALPDTYGTAAFGQIPNNSLTGWTGFRQDSGDPIAMGKLLVDYCHFAGIPPKVVFSDSLDVRRMSVIEDNFPDVECLFGWGTDLTNDLGYEPLSIVIKPCAVQAPSTGKWIACVKISDDIAKATGDPAMIRKFLNDY